MLKGCLALLAVFAVAFILEKREMDRRTLPKSWLAAAILAGGIALVAGSLQGIAEAWRTKGAPEDHPSQWQDGRPVRLGGLLRSTGRALQAPFSGRDAVVLWYNATALHWDEHNRMSRPSFRGIDVVPCVLETAAGRLDVVGVPNLQPVPEEQFSGGEHLDRAANHVAKTRWTPAKDVISAGAELAEAIFSSSPVSVPENSMNGLAREVLGFDGGNPSVEAIRQRLAEGKWLLRERILSPGAEVTVVGTYRANPPRIDVGYGPSSAQHSITPGKAEATASRAFAQTLIFAFVLAALTAASHYAVFASEGALYRGLMERFGS